MNSLNKVVFVVKEHKVKIKHVLMVIVIILLLFLLRCCNSKSNDKEETIIMDEVCIVAKKNIEDINDLLSSADLCNEVWYENVDVLIKHLEKQNKIMKKSDQQIDKDLYKKQAILLEKLKAFQREQTTNTIDEMEKAFKEYKKFVNKNCESEE